MSSPSIISIFNQFAGMEIKDPQRATCDIDLNLVLMETFATANGVGLRVLFPDLMMSDCQYIEDRVNATVRKGGDGKYRVISFNIG